MNVFIVASCFTILTIFLVILLIPWKSDKEKPPEVKTLKTMKVNGVTITLNNEEVLEMERQQMLKELEDLKIRKEYLVRRIKDDYDNSTDIIRRKVLEEILNKPIINDTQYAEVDFLYNDGKLRSNEEVRQHSQYIAMQNERKNYDNEVSITNFISFFVPFLIVTVIAGLAMHELGIFGFVFGLFFGLIAGIIGSVIGHGINIDNAKVYGIPDNDPRVIKEKVKRASDIAAGVGSVISVSRHTKRAVKDITNVDSWKEMK